MSERGEATGKRTADLASANNTNLHIFVLGAIVIVRVSSLRDHLASRIVRPISASRRPRTSGTRRSKSRANNSAPNSSIQQLPEIDLDLVMAGFTCKMPQKIDCGLASHRLNLAGALQSDNPEAQAMLRFLQADPRGKPSHVPE